MPTNDHCMVLREGGERCKVSECLRQRTCPEKTKAMERMRVLLLCSGRVRDGLWIRGAPTHVLAEFSAELAKEGWELRKIA